jgi:anti-sigma factor RsiW
MPTRRQSPNTGEHKSGRDCLDVEWLAAYAEHKLQREEALTVESHLSRCRECRRTVILTLRNKGLIDEATSADPADS